MNQKQTIGLLLTALMAAVILAACGFSTVQIGMLENHLPGMWQASYATFTGTKTDSFRADTGQTLFLKYDVQVEKGTLDIQVKNPDGELVWDGDMQKDESGTAQVALKQPGRYNLLIEGQDAGGSWDLNWDVQ